MTKANENLRHDPEARAAAERYFDLVIERYEACVEHLEAVRALLISLPPRVDESEIGVGAAIRAGRLDSFPALRRARNILADARRSRESETAIGNAAAFGRGITEEEAATAARLLEHDLAALADQRAAAAS